MIQIRNHADGLPNVRENRKEIRVLHLCQFPPYFAGHGIYLLRLFPFLSDFSVTSIGYGSDPEGRGPAVEKLNGTLIYRCDTRGGPWIFYRSLTQFLVRHRSEYDVLHSHGFWDRFGFLWLICRLLRKPVILQMVLLGSDDPETFLRIYRMGRLRLALLQLVTRVVPISTPLAQSCLRAGVSAERITKIPQGVDTERFRPLHDGTQRSAIRSEFGISSDAKVAIFLGAIVERKGVDLLLEAWSKVQSEVDDATLLMVGPRHFSGDDSGEINDFACKMRAYADSRSLRVVWTGKRDDPERLLAAADVFAFPSRQEGFGNVIIEASACGLPVVVTPMDGVAEDTVEHGVNGYIVSDVDSLASRLIELLRDPALASWMGQNGRSMALERFPFVKIAGMYREMYTAALRAVERKPPIACGNT